MKSNGLTACQLKTIACVCMLCDHIAAMGLMNGSFPPYILMRTIGRIAFPIFAFLTTEGLAHTHSRLAYFTRLFWFALLSQIPYSVAFHTMTFNTIFTLLLGSICLYAIKTWGLAGVLSGILFCFLSNGLDYGLFGIVLILSFGILAQQKYRLLFIWALLFLYYINIEAANGFYVLGASVSIVLIQRYNGEKGSLSKWLFYLFYPTHLLLLVFLSYA